MKNNANFIHLSGQKSSLVIACQEASPRIVYWGNKLSDEFNYHSLIVLGLRQEAPSSVANELPIDMLPTIGQGFSGFPGIAVSGEADKWGLKLAFVDIQYTSQSQVSITCEDPHRQVTIIYRVEIDCDSDVLSFSTEVLNRGSKPLNMEWCAAATIPLEVDCDQLLSFEGAWAKEFQLQRHQLKSGIYLRENRKGRTSHDNFPGFIVHQNTTNEYQGHAYGFHLGWSGNSRNLINQLGDGRRYAQLGELLLPGEVTLAHGQRYQSPNLYASYTAAGFSALSHQFHQYVRKHFISDVVKNKPRPVHYNTWEGLYFDHDMATLQLLANKASHIGAERFVLDDGWFVGRNDDSAGLGDWFIDKAKYPDGLQPLIAKVNELGMEFGIWFEPEMVNPNSELYRKHPDWALAIPHNEQLTFRKQVVLDLTREEVQEYLFTCIDDLLTQYNIAYIKWDMNRDLNHPGDQFARPAVNRQTQAVYALIARIKQKHPRVEIESCSSGGARADYGVLQHTDRVWTSDNNDALERLSIQQGFSFFFPPELMGSHVGPRDCHITHRHFNIDTRAAVTFFGHMGMEMDLRELTDRETQRLKAMVLLYKQHRHLIHTGFVQRLETQKHMLGVGVISEDRQEALFAYHLLKVHHSSLPGRFKLHGLDYDKSYRLEIIWPIQSDERYKAMAVFNFENSLALLDGKVFSGQILCEFGMEMPLFTPQSALIFHLQATEV